MFTVQTSLQDSYLVWVSLYTGFCLAAPSVHQTLGATSLGIAHVNTHRTSEHLDPLNYRVLLSIPKNIFDIIILSDSISDLIRFCLQILDATANGISIPSTESFLILAARRNCMVALKWAGYGLTHPFSSQPLRI
jgi:hypothetical protein